MTDPLSRLRAGLDRDEAIARAIDDKQEDTGWGIITYPGVSGFTISPHIGRVHESEAAEQIVRFGPDRALRQSDVFRKLLDLHQRVEWDTGVFVCDHCRTLEWDYAPEGSAERPSNAVLWPCATVELLASIYPEDATEK